MSTMRFADEVVPKSKIDGVPSRVTKPKPKELALANQIIDSLSETWDPKRYHDTYTEVLRDLIERKADGEEIEVDRPEEGKATVVDLMAVLQQSVEEARKGRKRTSARKSSGTKKRAAARKAPVKKRAAAKKSA
jgi:DNA end-binding protein Ku